MPDPISFPATTANAQLPLLLSGQSQKELFVNQSLAVLDALVPMAVEAVQDQPPSDPIEGQCYLVSSAGTGDWSDHSDALAIRVGGGWHYVNPTVGMAMFDRATNERLVYSAQWDRIQAPTSPTGGSVVDTEARATIDSLISALVSAGLLASAP